MIVFVSTMGRTARSRFGPLVQSTKKNFGYVANSKRYHLSALSQKQRESFFYGAAIMQEAAVTELGPM